MADAEHSRPRMERPLGPLITRRRLVQYGAGTGAGLLLCRFEGGRAWAQPPAGGVLDPGSIPKYVTPLVIPPAMPRSATPPPLAGAGIDYYQLAVRQFEQQILPSSTGIGTTTVWSYGS